MSYINRLLAKDEVTIYETGLHWVIFALPVLCLVIGAIALRTKFAEVESASINQAVVAVLFLTLGVFTLVRAFINYRTTEIAVTTMRMVYTRGFIARDTIEISLNLVEDLGVKQSELGRILNFGTAIIRGTGLGVQPIHRVAKPVSLRDATLGYLRRDAAAASLQGDPSAGLLLTNAALSQNAKS